MIVKLENSLLTAGIDTMGAQLISLKDSSGTEYIWQRDPAVWKNCSPILFPIVCPSAFRLWLSLPPACP